MADALHHPNPNPGPDPNLIWQVLFIILTLAPTLTLPLIWQVLFIILTLTPTLTLTLTLITRTQT
jgi:hypothetical protein